MAAATLNEVLNLVGKLRSEDREMLMEILRRRESDAWRKQVAAYGQKARRELRAGKLKAMTAAEANAHLNRIWEAPDE